MNDCNVDIAGGQGLLGLVVRHHHPVDLVDIDALLAQVFFGDKFGAGAKAVEAYGLAFQVFGLDDVNDLPIIYNIAWYEQKAVIVLLALLYLGVKNIHLGPTLPAFLSPNVAKVLIENFGIAGIGTVEEDMEKFFGINA